MKKRPSFLRMVLGQERNLVNYFRDFFFDVPSRTYFALAFLGFVLAVTLLSVGWTESSPLEYQVGQIVRSDIIAPESFTVADPSQTDVLRKEAADKVPGIFSYDTTISPHASERLADAFEQFRNKFRDAVSIEFGSAALPERSRKAGSARYQRFLQKFIENERHNFPSGGGEAALQTLAELQFNTSIENRMLDLLSSTMSLMIYPDQDAGKALGGPLQVYNVQTGRLIEADPRLMISFSAARAQIQNGLNDEDSLNDLQRRALTRLILDFLSANAQYDASRTGLARQAAARGVPEVKEIIQKGQIISRNGDVVTPEILRRIAALRDSLPARFRPWKFAGLLFANCILLLGLWKVSERTKTYIMTGVKTFAVVSVTLVVNLTIIRLGMIVAERFDGASFSSLGTQYQFAIPFAATAMLVALIIDLKLAFVCGLLVGVYTGLISDHGVELGLFSTLSSFVAVYSVGRYRQRSVVTIAGLSLTVMNMIIALIVICVGGHFPSWQILLVDMLLAAAGGVLNAAFVSLEAPIYESIFNILTDVKLLELSNADLPLLKRLAIEAPGTHQHSYMVSGVAEEAAKAIGANSLLVRIGCYYHDIGKLGAPHMFIENQRGGPNPHDYIAPDKSSRVITNHVRRGIELAREAKIPPQIIDLIPQHHGTRLLHFFYNKAKEQANGKAVDEQEFRYPGPKPQTKEAAILMLADAAEAAVRSLDDPTPPNIRSMLKMVTDDVFADCQLDESNLTMREVTAVREALIGALINHHHHRISYPGFNTGEEADQPSEPPPELTPQQATLLTRSKMAEDPSAPDRSNQPS